jgi:hypothetical protein
MASAPRAPAASGGLSGRARGRSAPRRGRKIGRRTSERAATADDGQSYFRAAGFQSRPLVAASPGGARARPGAKRHLRCFPGASQRRLLGSTKAISVIVTGTYYISHHVSRYSTDGGHVERGPNDVGQVQTSPPFQTSWGSRARMLCPCRPDLSSGFELLQLIFAIRQKFPLFSGI